MTSRLIVLTTVCSILFVSGCGKTQSVEMFPKEGQTAQATSEETAASIAPATTTANTQATAAVVSSTPISAAAFSQSQGVLPTDAMERTKTIQTALKSLNLYTGNIDGKIGPLTEQAVRNFQSAHNLNADGKVGPLTWAELSKYVSSPQAASSEGHQQ